MGCNASNLRYLNISRSRYESEAKSEFDDENIPNDQEMKQLEMFLSNPIRFNYLNKYKNDQYKSDLINCWGLINSKFPKTNDILSYVMELSVERDRKGMKPVLTSHFDELKYIMFHGNDSNTIEYIKNLLLTLIYLDIYKDILIEKSIKNNMNNVYYNTIPDINTSNSKCNHNDFVYLNKINEGGFGIVLSCLQMSTNKIYAMKIQTKDSISKYHKYNTLNNITQEINAHIKLKHSQLLPLSYAFHTTKLAIMVLPLSTCGDLAKILKLSGSMDIHRVQFYCVEILSVLSYDIFILNL